MCRVGEGLRTGKTGKLINVPDYQPTLMALLFASIWDITALPPRQAPRYGWWDETDTAAARLWQNHTKDLNLNYQVSRELNPDHCVPRILNGDPRSSRTSFIATFFYLCSELSHDHLDVMLIDWILEQLIEDVSIDHDQSAISPWSQSLWLWCVMFGAAIAQLGRPSSMIEQRQLQKWRDLYDDKIRLVSQALGISKWDSARNLFSKTVGSIDDEADKGLKELWDQALIRGQTYGWYRTSSTVEELNDERSQ